MVYTIETARIAERVLEHFNYFHDGFIKRVELVSHDRFEQNGPAYTDRAHVCTGMFDITLDIAHYNYGPGDQPYHRLITCRCEDVRDFALDLRGHQGHDWPITRIDIVEVTRANGFRPGEVEPALELRLLRPFLVDGKRWERREQSLFTFARATLEEGLVQG